ncbi:hypothetical protein BS78_04G211200 [Paspalum vaginatum]|nr:hypothetical protein BS78_04G211200 [Paspalum vaginatum]
MLTTTTRRHGGFRLGRKLLSVWRWALCHRRRRRGRGYLRLKPSSSSPASSPAACFLSATSIKKQQQRPRRQFVVRGCERDDADGGAESSPGLVLTTWGRSLARRMRLRLLRRKEEERLLEEAATPKGQVAVYVGAAEPGGESMRYVVPVVYFNHPLFGELLREAEEEFGFHHPGGITIPCAAARFERAAAVAAAGKKLHGPGWW